MRAGLPLIIARCDGRIFQATTMQLQWLQFSVRRLLIVTACIGAAVAIGRFYLFRLDPFLGYATIYSEQYTETGFNSLRIGMSSEDVRSIMDSPLRSVPWSGCTYPVPGGDENWEYTIEPKQDGNYHRRWIIFRNHRILAIVNEFYLD